MGGGSSGPGPDGTDLEGMGAMEMTERSDRQQELSRQAKQIIAYSRKLLAQELPELLPAIYLLGEREEEQPMPMSTNGSELLYYAEDIVQAYLKDKGEVQRQLLHLLLHGLLGHFSKRRGQEELIFDALADLKVVQTSLRLNHKAGRPKGLTPNTMRSLKKLGGQSLEASYLQVTRRSEAEAILLAALPVQSDDHHYWLQETEKNGEPSGQLELLWETAANQVAETMSRGKKWGSLPGDICRKYRKSEGSGVSYREFMRRFVSCQEQRRLDPDSFDRVWYWMGMELTGDAPILEPLELRESPQVSELVVALDTSGSCAGAEMDRLLGELLALMQDLGAASSHVTLLQCDAKIQGVQTLTREDTVDAIRSGLTIAGCGGTDFRPVFQYIAQEREQGRLTKISALIYLTDGYGTFPQAKPAYPTVFLIPEDRDSSYRETGIPGWATVLDVRLDGTLHIREERTE